MTMVKVRLPPAVVGLPGTRGPFPKFSGGQTSAPAVARPCLDISSERGDLQGDCSGSFHTLLILSADFEQNSRALQPQKQIRSHGNTPGLKNNTAPIHREGYRIRGTKEP